MKLLILSDLHCEIEPFSPARADFDVVVLAGDIDHGVAGIRWAQAQFSKPVVMVAGNHEFHDGCFDATPAELRAAAEGTNVHLLEDGWVVLDGVRFLGSTLWTDFELTGDSRAACEEAESTKNDFRSVTRAGRELTPRDHVTRHRASRDYLFQKLCEPHDGPTVVVTHHAPSEQSLDPRFVGVPGHLSAGYASDLRPLLALPMSLWVHGHAHVSFDYELQGTRVVCNPRGHAHKRGNPRFNPELVLEV